MLQIILNKLLVIVFIMSALNILRHLFFIIQIWATKQGERERYTLPNKSIIILGLSIAYIITSIITGIYV